MLMDVIEDARVLELDAECGAVGFEALSRGAAHATFVTSDTRAVKALKENARQLACVERCRVCPLTVYDFLGQPAPPDGTYDVVFVNPTHQQERAVRIVQHLYDWPRLAPGACLALYHDISTATPPAADRWRMLADRRYGKHQLTLWQRAVAEA